MFKGTSLQASEVTTAIAKIIELQRKGALFVVNHSGGKDSQAMFHYVRQFVPDEQIVNIHAPLGRAEWEGTWEHVLATTEEVMEPRRKTTMKKNYEAKAYYKDGRDKTFFNYVQHRTMFPSKSARFCTSDLKRGPIVREITQLSNKFGFKIIVNCTGLRAEESNDRAEKPVLIQDMKRTNRKRDWYEWLPIKYLSTEEVFEIIKRVGQEPHWVYKAGMSRASCCFCILASKADLQTAARLKPALYADYVKLENDLGHTLQMSGKSLEAFTGIKADLSLATI